MYSKEFVVGNKTRRLKYDFNAIADIEESSGMGMAKIFSAEMMGLHTIRLLVWAGLKHEDPGITIQRAGMIIRDMMAEDYALDDIMVLITDALSNSGVFPKDTFDGDDKQNENPTMPEKSGQSLKKSKN